MNTIEMTTDLKEINKNSYRFIGIPYTIDNLTEISARINKLKKSKLKEYGITLFSDLATEIKTHKFNVIRTYNNSDWDANARAVDKLNDTIYSVMHCLATTYFLQGPARHAIACKAYDYCDGMLTSGMLSKEKMRKIEEFETSI